MADESLVPLEVLRTYLGFVPPGSVDDSGDLSDTLAEAWPFLSGDVGESGMSGDKLRGRMETVVWAPPVLSFSIERHGATVMGSTRAKVQHWTVDTATAKVRLFGEGVRQLYPMQARLQVRPIAEDLVGAIVHRRQDDARLKWVGPDRVRIMIGAVVPLKGPKETAQGRRRRLSHVLQELLEARGWLPVAGTAPHTYARTRAEVPGDKIDAASSPVVR